MDSFPDPRSLTDQGLKELIRNLSDEVIQTSSDPRSLREEVDDLGAPNVDSAYKRRVLHGKLEILRGELVRRRGTQDQGGDDSE